MTPMIHAGVRLSMFLALLFGAVPGRACTIFVLTDEHHALFFNNEDFSDPATRLWFVPAGEGYLGCAYVGFTNGWAQGGVNTAGLAFDWVAGPDNGYQPAPGLVRVRGNPSQRMLETCTSVEEAIVFYRAHRETEFARGAMLIADRSGASVMVSATGSELRFDRQIHSRGFGFGGNVLRERLERAPSPTVAGGVEILRACRQEGANPTQYSNVYDLQTGEIVIYPNPPREESVRLQLADELAKGGHFYAIPQIARELANGGAPLTPQQQRFYLDGWKPRAQPDAAVVATITRLLREAAQGKMQSRDYSPGLWAGLEPAREDLRHDLAGLGELRRVTLVESPGGSGWRCLAEFAGARVLQRWQFDATGCVTELASEFVELERL